MKRIYITGNAGAGKSALAGMLGLALNRPVVGLDAIVWRAGWQKTPEQEKNKRIQQLINSSDTWIIEGVSRAVMDAADTIIFLDVPRRVCLWRCFNRNRKYLLRSRPGLPQNCPEILIVPKLISIILNFPKRVRPLILNHFQEHKGKKSILILDGMLDEQSVLDLLARSLAEEKTVSSPSSS